MTSSDAASPMDRLWAVVPAGGAGTRLWPLSRAGRPKFLLDLTGSGRTLIQATVDRLTPLVGERVVVVTGAAHEQAVRRQLPEVDRVIAEPSPRDSMAAIGLAAAQLEREDPDALIGSFAADHVITDEAAFAACVREAAAVADDGLLVTIGIEPTHAATGFGYVRGGAALDRSRHCAVGRRVRREAGRRPGRRPTWRRGSTAGTPASSWSGPRCCSTCSPRTTPSSRPGCARSRPTRRRWRSAGRV